MRRRTFMAATTAVTVPLVAGCTGGAGSGGDAGGGDGGDGGGGASGATTIAIENTAFEPIRASVAPGSTVDWVNKDGVTHDVTSTRFHDAAASWDYTKEVPGGERVSRTFEGEGVYEYYCSIHGQDTMCGVVLVGDVSLDGDLPCEDGDGGGGGGGYGGGGYG